MHEYLNSHLPAMVREDLLICWLTLTLGGSLLGAFALAAWYRRRLASSVPSDWLLDVGEPDMSRRYAPWNWRSDHRHPDTPPTVARRFGRWLGVAR